LAKLTTNFSGGQTFYGKKIKSAAPLAGRGASPMKKPPWDGRAPPSLPLAARDLTFETRAARERFEKKCAARGKISARH
jgi:hypothetical protein